MEVQTYISLSFLILHSVVFGMGASKSLIYRLYGPLLVLVDSIVELSISRYYKKNTATVRDSDDRSMICIGVWLAGLRR